MRIFTTTLLLLGLASCAQKTVQDCHREAGICLQQCTAPGMKTNEAALCASECDKRAKRCADNSVF
ncbi:MAG: hypothetical protein F9K24_09240 [Leptonema illini]|uniref:Lipoprotein n=1 Tax=Leptonema illini TaxID=183 RepID=A0A833H255_9LEPT|nr:hypothetical protein [Leptonema illini]KAB2933041.1 MAG: hypothetical protein F9K24_09240 [Leptonema illini]